jgi:hypothetical protein
MLRLRVQNAAPTALGQVVPCLDMLAEANDTFARTCFALRLHHGDAGRWFDKSIVRDDQISVVRQIADLEHLEDSTDVVFRKRGAQGALVLVLLCRRGSAMKEAEHLQQDLVTMDSPETNSSLRSLALRCMDE